MYVCVCQGVTERQIQEAAQQGARYLRDLRRELGVTLDCGRCASCAHQCLKKARAQQDEHVVSFDTTRHPLTSALLPA